MITPRTRNKDGKHLCIVRSFLYIKHWSSNFILHIVFLVVNYFRPFSMNQHLHDYVTRTQFLNLHSSRFLSRLKKCRWHLLFTHHLPKSQSTGWLTSSAGVPSLNKTFIGAFLELATTGSTWPRNVIKNMMTSRNVQPE